MKTLVLRMFLIILCLVLPCTAIAETIAPDKPVVHADFTLGLALHADAFPPSEAHLKDWEAFLKRLSLSGSLNATRVLQPDSRVYMEAALCLDGEEAIPFTYDEYGVFRYLISPMLRGDSTLLSMASYFEFMLKPYYYLGLPTNYIALLTYPAAVWYIADSYYSPVRGMLAGAREAALADAGDEAPEALTYVIPYDRLLALCAELNAVVVDDTRLKRVQRFLEALLAELNISDAMLEGMSHVELLLYMLDPEMRGMTVEETAGGMVCTIGDTAVFIKSTAGDVTELAFRLPIADDSQISLTYQSEDFGDSASISAAVSVTEGEDTLISLSAEGSGLPAEGALGGEGSVTFTAGGLKIAEVPIQQTFAFRWSRTAAELPYDLDLAVDWVHPDTGLPAFSVYLSSALEASDYSVFENKNYPQQNFFGLNPVLLEEFKERWGPTILAYLLPVALELPVGVIDDIVYFLLDTDILISIVE